MNQTLMHVSHITLFLPTIQSNEMSILPAQDHARVTRQATNFERKLTQLKSMDATELADMMQHEGDSLYRLNSVDYLDFELKN
jgi:hypothetical protein